MDRAIDLLLDQQVVDGLDVLVLARVRCPQDRTNANGILIHQIDRFFRINHVPRLRAVDIFLLDIEIPRRFLPAHLHRAIHHNIRARAVLALSLAAVLPALLHRQHGQHDTLRGSDGRCANGVLVVWTLGGWGV
jgi:hypothetical protein